MPTAEASINPSPMPDAGQGDLRVLSSLQAAHPVLRRQDTLASLMIREGVSAARRTARIVQERGQGRVYFFGRLPTFYQIAGETTSSVLRATSTVWGP